jgi:hypothetical protein
VWTKGGESPYSLFEPRQAALLCRFWSGSFAVRLHALTTSVSSPLIRAFCTALYRMRSKSGSRASTKRLRGRFLIEPASLGTSQRDSRTRQYASMSDKRSLRPAPAFLQHAACSSGPTRQGGASAHRRGSIGPRSTCYSGNGPEPVPLNGCSSVRSLTGDQLPLFGQSDYSLSSCKLDVSLRVAQLCPLMRDMVDTTRHDIQSMRFTAISALQQDLA